MGSDADGVAPVGKGVEAGETTNASVERVAELEAELERLEKINRVLMDRVERGMDLAGGDYSLFLTATVLEQKVQQRTGELEKAMRRVEVSHEKLLVAKEGAEEAVRSKDAFLASMSHELRTPLNSMLGRTETILEGVLGQVNSQQRASLGMIDSSGRHLLALINDILDIAKAGAGEAVLRMAPIDLGEVCESSVSTIAVDAVKKGLRLSFDMDPAEIVITADERRIKQILLNLLGNAVKYTPANGGVDLVVRGDVAGGVVRLSVADTGIGISSEDMHRLFQPFVQLDSALSRSYDGTGLGLALVKDMTELHGGTVAVESEPGQGSTFCVALPWPQSEDVSTKSAAAGPLSLASGTAPVGPTVLLAEDNPANVGMIEPYLVAKGFRLVIAWDGIEAVDKALEIRPDLILMDIQMPRMDGLEATRKIRAAAGMERVPIIALTALAMPGDEDRCMQAGATRYLTKPVRLQHLVSVLDEHLPESWRTSAVVGK